MYDTIIDRAWRASKVVAEMVLVWQMMAGTIKHVSDVFFFGFVAYVFR